MCHIPIQQVFVVAIWIVSFFSGFVPFAIYFTDEIRDRTSGTDKDAIWPSCSVAYTEGW